MAAVQRAAALAAALLVLPVAATMPLLYLRGSGVFEADPATGLPRRLPLITMDEGITGIQGMRMPAAMALQLIDVVDFVWGNTATDEPIFVYPSMPMLYVVTERPNPTRYGHVYPGIPVPEVDALLASLESERVGLVVTSDAWNRPYSREKAAYPAAWIRERKFWPAVGRVESAYGDRNLVCACVPTEAYVSAAAASLAQETE